MKISKEKKIIPYYCCHRSRHILKPKIALWRTIPLTVEKLVINTEPKIICSACHDC